MKNKLLVITLGILVIAGLIAGALYIRNNKFGASTLVLNSDNSMTRTWSAKDSSELTLVNTVNDGSKISLSREKDVSFKFPTQESFQIYGYHSISASSVSGDIYVLGQAGAEAYGPNPKLVYEIAQFKSDGTFIRKIDMSFFHSGKDYNLPGKMRIGADDSIYIAASSPTVGGTQKNYIYKFDSSGNLMVSFDLNQYIPVGPDFALDSKNQDVVYILTRGNNNPSAGNYGSIRAFDIVKDVAVDSIDLKSGTITPQQYTSIAVSDDKVYLGEKTYDNYFRVVAWKKHSQGAVSDVKLAIADCKGNISQSSYSLEASSDGKDLFVVNTGDRSRGQNSCLKMYDAGSGISYRKLLYPNKLVISASPNKKLYVLAETNDKYFNLSYYHNITVINNTRNNSAAGSYLENGSVDVVSVDSGQSQSDWTNVSWKGDTPTNTAVKACLFASDSPEELAKGDLTTNCFDSNTVATNLKGRYAKIRLVLSTTNAQATPSLTEFSLSYKMPKDDLAIVSVTPASGPVYSRITIKGNGFGADIGSVKLGDVVIPSSNITKWTDAAVGVYLPFGAKDGKLTVNPAGTDKYVTTSEDFKVTTVPVISELSTVVKDGKNILTVRGKNFGDTIGSIRIEWTPINTNAKTAKLIQKWSDQEIIVEVPNKPNYDAGKVLIINKDNKLSFSEDQYINPQKSTK